MNGHLQKRLGDRLRKVFTGIHSMRSLSGATTCLLAVLRHIRSSVCSLVVEHRLTLAAGGQFWTVFEHTNGIAAPEMTDGNDNAFRIEGFCLPLHFLPNHSTCALRKIEIWERNAPVFQSTLSTGFY
jgi:hypothetical protein